MTCDRATELLPWLLNGTLAADERREVIEHLRGCAACRAALADTEQAWGIFDWHPPVAALVAYAEASGATGPTGATGVAATAAAAAGGGEAREIEEHVADCPRCAAELELVRTSRLLADPAEDGRIAILQGARPAGTAAAPAETARQAIRRDDAAARRAWQRSALAASVVGLLAATGWFESARHSRDLERRVAALPAVSALPATPANPALPALPANIAIHGAAPKGSGDADLRRRAGEAEAKLSALAEQNQRLEQQVSALGRTAAELGQRSDTLRQSQPARPARPAIIESDLLVTDLAPAEQTERGAEPPAAAAIPLSAGAATLLLHTRHRQTYTEYEIEVRDARGSLVGPPARVLRLPGTQDSLEEFDITLGRGALAPGAYTLHLFGRTGHAGGTTAGPATGPAGGARETLETYSIRVS